MHSLVLLVLVLKTSSQVPLLQSSESQLLINDQTGQVGFTQKKKGFECESRRGVNEMQIYEAGWQEFEVIIFPF
jgi:hypothetical protein